MKDYDPETAASSAALRIPSVISVYDVIMKHVSSAGITVEGLLIHVGLKLELKGSFFTSRTQISHHKVQPEAALDFISIV